MALKTGDKAPDFTLTDENGKPFRLAEALSQPIMLVFYPGDNTPVCTAQLCEYRDGIEQFADLDIRVVGISSDDAASHVAFKQKHKLPFTLLSDTDLSVAEHYGCKSLLGMKRGVFLVDAEQRIRWIDVQKLALFRQRKDDILEAVRSLALS